MTAPEAAKRARAILRLRVDARMGIVARSRELGSSILARREPCEHPASDRDLRVEAVLHDSVAIAMRDWQ